jgi:ammonium transporter Rh
MPKLEESIGLYDTCGVHNLHGMPGVLGGLASVITAGFATHALYGDNIGDVYPKMGSDGRSASQQVP